MKSVCKHVTNSHQNNISQAKRTDWSGIWAYSAHGLRWPCLSQRKSQTRAVTWRIRQRIRTPSAIQILQSDSHIPSVILIYKLWNLSSCKCYYDDVTVKLGSLFSMINGRQSTTCILSVTVRPQNVPLRKCNKPLSHTHIQANSPSLSVFSWHCTKSDFACRHQCGRVCVCVCVFYDI